MRMSRSAAALAVGFLVASITITPASHDFGDVAVNASVAKDFLVGGVANRDSALAILTGPDATQWIIQDGAERCWVNLQDSIPCSFNLSFWPKSLGPKTATLVVRDYHGNRVTAQLKGKGVQALCEMKVVFCNYAHLYSGVFKWDDVLRAPKASTVIAVEAKVDSGRVSCNGTETLTDEGGSRVLTSNGNGLIAVEFKVDDTMRQVYNITVACPSPGDADTPSQRAELGHFDQQSYDQRTTAAGVPVAPGVDVIGDNSYESGTDPVNNVTGRVTVTWNLKRQ